MLTAMLPDYHAHWHLRSLPACLLSCSTLTVRLDYHANYHAHWHLRSLPACSLPCSTLTVVLTTVLTGICAYCQPARWHAPLSLSGLTSMRTGICAHCQHAYCHAPLSLPCPLSTMLTPYPIPADAIPYPKRGQWSQAAPSPALAKSLVVGVSNTMNSW